MAAINQRFNPTVDIFQNEVGEWANVTFPQSNTASIMSHLLEEVAELSVAAVNDIRDEAQEEAADCLLLLLHFAHKQGFSLYAAAAQKLALNQLRTWETDDNGRGHWKHVETS